MCSKILAKFSKGRLISISLESSQMTSQMTLLFWPCLSLIEIQRTFNHMIIFNDLNSKFYLYSIRGFWRSISLFFSIWLAQKKKKKKNAGAIRSLGILKNMSPWIKYIFVSKMKAIFCLIKKFFFFVYTVLKHDFITQAICCIIHRCVHSLFIIFLSSYISF